MFGKKKRKQEDATNVTKAGVAPTAELDESTLETVSGGRYEVMGKCEKCGGPLSRYFDKGSTICYHCKQFAPRRQMGVR